MKIKHGVSLSRLSHHMLLVWLVVDSLWADAGSEAVITSGRDGVHSQRSKHYTGQALDFRTNTLTSQEVQRLAQECRDILGNDYDVVVEANHLHIEYDPKEA